MYSVCGVIIFGHRVAGFANVAFAMQTTALIVMGDVDWSELERIGRGPALIWLITFTIVIVLLMLNMLLAIIFETYSEVRSKIGSHAETLVSQLLEIVRRRRAQRRGDQLSLSKIQA